jgi:hypothetical protein
MEDLPCVMIYNSMQGIKFKMGEEEITKKNILEFFKGYQNHDLKKHLKSEPIPLTQTGFV